MSYQYTFSRSGERRTDARGSSGSGGQEGGKWIQRALFATGASLFVVSLAIVTGAGPLSPLGPVADDREDPDQSTPRPVGTEEPAATGTPTSAPTPTGTARPTTRTTNGSVASPTSSTQDPFAGIGEDSPTPTADGNRTATNPTVTATDDQPTTTTSGSRTTTSPTPTATGGTETTTGQTTTSEDDGILG